jgi:hypothetical protein
MQPIQATQYYISLAGKHLLQPRTKIAGAYLPFHTPLQNNQELPQPISLYDKNLVQYRAKIVGADLPQCTPLVLQNIKPYG